MAANTSPIYPLTGFGSPASVSTVNADVTGATGSMATIVTGGTNGSLVTAIVFRPVSHTGSGTVIHLFHTSSTTHRNIGSVEIPAGHDPSLDIPLQVTWSNPNGSYPLKNGDKIEAAMIRGTTVFHCQPIGGDY